MGEEHSLRPSETKANAQFRNMKYHMDNSGVLLFTEKGIDSNVKNLALAQT